MSVLTEEQILKEAKTFEVDVTARLILVNKGLMNIEKVSILKNLYYLNISNNEISDLSHALGLPNIQIIIADNNNVSELSCTENTSLIYLSLKNNKISSPQGISELARCSGLLSLNLLGNPIEKQPELLKYILDNVEQIHTLNNVRIRLTNGEIVSEVAPKQAADQPMEQIDLPVCDWVESFPEIPVNDWDAEFGSTEEELREEIATYWEESKRSQQ